MLNSFANRSYRLPFTGSDGLKRNYSQAGQDLFVLSMLDGKRDGIFLDLGCNQPILMNNTYLLESEFSWKGLCVDIDEQFFELFVFRGAQTLVADCTKLDWDAVIERLGTTTVDYLSLDLEPPAVTLECLRSIPFGKIRFGVITFEHDAYRAGETVREPSRKLLDENGYVRISTDVKLEGLEFEDWYYHPDLVDVKRCEALSCDKKDWEDVIFV